MPEHVLTFEQSPDGTELFIHADAAGLRHLASVLTRLARKAEQGVKDHEHMMTPEWAGHQLSSEARDTSATVLNKVTIHGWPEL